MSIFDYDRNTMDPLDQPNTDFEEMIYLVFDYGCTGKNVFVSAHDSLKGARRAAETLINSYVTTGHAPFVEQQPNLWENDYEAVRIVETVLET